MRTHSTQSDQRSLKLEEQAPTPSLSPNRIKHNAEHRRKFGQTPSTLDIEWRIAMGKSPNPWGVDKSEGFDTQQIITRHKLSRLERKTLEMEADDLELRKELLK